MANNFEAIISARLDKTQLNSEIEKLQNTKYELRNIHIAPNNLAKEIQNALDSQRFNIDINPVIHAGGAGNSGKNLAQAVETAINTGIGSNPVTVNLKDALQFKGIDSKVADGIIKSVSKDIDSATIKLKSFDAQFEETVKNGRRLQSIKFVGIDDDGKTLNILSKIDKKTGEVISTVTHVTQKFDVETKSIDKTKEAFNRLLKVQKAIGNVEFKLANNDFDDDGKSAEELRRQLQNLQKEYSQLYTQEGANFSKSQLSQLSDEAEKASNRIRELHFGIQDNIELKISTKKVDAEISNVTRRINNLKNVSSADAVDLGLDDDLVELQRLRSLMDNLSGAQLEDAYGNLSTLLDTIKNKLSIISNENKNVVSSLDVAKLSNKMKTWLEKNTKASKDFGVAIENLIKQLENLDTSSEDAATQVKRIDTKFQGIQQSAISTGKVGKSFGTSLKNAFNGILGLVSASTILSKAVETLKDMYQAVYDIDTAMIELKKVTEETASSYEKFLSGSGDVAKRIGTTITDYVNSTADFARLGYDFKSSQELAQVANIYNVVGDDISSIEDATQSIISTMTAFNVSANESIGIVDKFNEVSNNYAISSGGIGTALQKSAAAMAAANNSLDETIALITAANTVVQDPDSVGTAFKTLSMRIRGAETELEEAGLDTDGMASSVSKLREEIMALSGVDIMIDDDTFKSTYDILKDLSEVWDQLTDVSQANVLELIAGKRQANIVSAVLDNFEIADKALATSLDSSGSALEEHSKYMESLKAKTQQLKAAYEELSQTVLSSDFLKGLVDVGTGVLETITKIIDSIGVLNTIAIGGGLIALIRNFD